MSQHDDAPELAFSLDLRTLRSWTEMEDGQPVLHLSDGAQHVAVESIAGESREEALTNARRLSDMAIVLFSLLEQSGPVDWWTPPEVVSK